MSMRTSTLPKQYHEAVLRWRDVFLPDYDFLIENWDKHFPNDPTFELCAYREMGMCSEIECGDMKGKPKAQKASRAAARAGPPPLRRHPRPGLDRVRLHPAAPPDARPRPGGGGAVLDPPHDGRGAAPRLPDAPPAGRGRLELRLQGVHLRHHRGHPVDEHRLPPAGRLQHRLRLLRRQRRLLRPDRPRRQVPARRCRRSPPTSRWPRACRRCCARRPSTSPPAWCRCGAGRPAAAKGETFVTMDVLQKTLNKWLPRGLEMFGDERGGGTNVRLGLKPMKNAEAQRQYYEEVAKLVRDLNLRYLRARVENLTHGESEAVARPHPGRRDGRGGAPRGPPPHAAHRTSSAAAACRPSAWSGAEGETFATVPEYLQHLIRILPEAYRASRDYKDYVEALTQVADGTMTAEQAAGRMPALRRVAGACPCSKSVRWMVDEPVRSPSCAGARAASRPSSPSPEPRSESPADAILRRGARDECVQPPAGHHACPLVPKPIVGRVASRYVAGETLDDAVRVIRALNQQGAMATLDVLGEEVSEREKALAAVEEYLRVFEAIDREKIDSNVSIKPTLLGLKIDEGFCRDNIGRIAETAKSVRQLRPHRHGGQHHDRRHAAHLPRAAGALRQRRLRPPGLHAPHPARHRRAAGRGGERPHLQGDLRRAAEDRLEGLRHGAGQLRPGPGQADRRAASTSASPPTTSTSPAPPRP